MIVEKNNSEWCIKKYEEFLVQEEKSINTMQKYLKEMKAFIAFLDGVEVSKILVLEYKDELSKNYVPTSVNSILAEINHFLRWLGLEECRVKLLKIQRDIFAKPEKELNKKDYEKLIQCAEKEGNRKLSLLLQTIGGTGIRVSELQYITVESVYAGRCQVNCKGKNRTVFLPKERKK